MQKIFKEYGGVITVAVAVVALIGIVAMLVGTPNGGIIGGAFEQVVTGFEDKASEKINGLGSGAGYEMLDGDGTKVDLSTPTPLVFRSSAPYNTFEAVKVDGEVVDESNYSVTEGSTIVTFTESYTQSLSSGEHTVEIVSKNGSASADFAAVYSIPAGGTYTVKTTNEVLEAGAELTEAIASGDIYAYGDYKYTYSPTTSGWMVSINTTVTDKKKTSYGEILPTIFGVPTTCLKQTFKSCTNLSTIPALPDTVVDMTQTFYGCTALSNLRSLQIPSSVTTMNSTFNGCKNLTYAPDLSGATGITLLQETFKGCTSLSTSGLPALPNGVQNLYMTFEGCTALKDLSGYVIPNSVKTLHSTFDGCTNITKAPAIPNSVTTLKYVFDSCSAMTVAPNLSQCSQLADMQYMFTGCTALKTYVGSTAGEGDFSGYVIPNSVTTLKGCFLKCSAITKAPAIPAGVTVLDSAFQLTGITTAPEIPSSATSMQYTFNGCTALTGEISLPCSLASKNYTFMNCPATVVYYHVANCSGSCGV